jgi:hypothetical protein
MSFFFYDKAENQLRQAPSKGYLYSTPAGTRKQQLEKQLVCGVVNVYRVLCLVARNFVSNAILTN